MSNRNRCQAKDPAKCPYHGNVYSRLSPAAILEARTAHLKSIRNHPSAQGTNYNADHLAAMYDTLYDATLSANTQLEGEVHDLQQSKRPVPKDLYDRLLAVQTLKVIRGKSSAAIADRRSKIEAQELLSRSRKNDHLVTVLNQEIDRLKEEYEDVSSKPNMVSPEVLSRAYGAAIYEIETFLQPLEKEQDNPTHPAKVVASRLTELFK